MTKEEGDQNTHALYTIDRRKKPRHDYKNSGFNRGHTGGKICRFCRSTCAQHVLICPVCGNK